MDHVRSCTMRKGDDRDPIVIAKTTDLAVIQILIGVELAIAIEIDERISCVANVANAKMEYGEPGARPGIERDTNGTVVIFYCRIESRFVHAGDHWKLQFGKASGIPIAGRCIPTYRCPGPAHRERSSAD